MKILFTLLVLVLSLTLSSMTFAKSYEGAEAEKIMIEGEVIPVSFGRIPEAFWDSAAMFKYKGSIFLCTTHPFEDKIKFIVCKDRH
jgi:hypothetical protein